MQIVIDIPEEMYKWVDDANKFFNHYGTSDFVDLIKKGTPLPKNHGRLIDADELKKIIRENDVLSMTGFSVRICDINNTPTIIEADKENEG